MASEPQCVGHVECDGVTVVVYACDSVVEIELGVYGESIVAELDGQQREQFQRLFMEAERQAEASA